MLGISLIVDQTPPKFLRLQSHLRQSFTVTDAVSFQPRNKEKVYCEDSEDSLKLFTLNKNQINVKIVFQTHLGLWNIH